MATTLGSALVIGVLTACEQPPRDVQSNATTASFPDTIRVQNAWVRAGASGAITGAYATVHNPRDSAAQIVAARSAVADTVELHETMQHDGMVHMEAQAMVIVPARDSVVFAPGGKHFMLRGLKRALAEGEQVPMQLLFSNGDSISFTAAVRSITGQ
jgi:copper(I)-binding protein